MGSLRILNCIWYNIITDRIVCGDAEGFIHVIDKSFLTTLRNNLTVDVKTNYRPPLFSLQQEQAAIANFNEFSNDKVIKPKDKSNLPYFSFGFRKSKSE